jgi:hypothetical protein
VLYSTPNFHESRPIGRYRNNIYYVMHNFHLRLLLHTLLCFPRALRVEGDPRARRRPAGGALAPRAKRRFARGLLVCLFDGPRTPLGCIRSWALDENWVLSSSKAHDYGRRILDALIHST